MLDQFSSKLNDSYTTARRAIFGNESFSSTTSNRTSSMSLLSMGFKTILNFSICFILGTFFIIAAFFFLPMIVISPQKFTLLFTLGSIFWIIGLGVLQGYQQLFAAMIKRDRLPYTASYVISLLGVFYATLKAHSYLLTLLFSITEIVSLSLFVVSYFPGGIRLITMIKEYLFNRLRGESFLPF